LKGLGLGRLLMEKMIAFLAGRGTQRMVGYILRENDPMRRLARSLGFEADPSRPGEDSVFVALNLPRPAHEFAE
jgi:acetyltransferase